MDPLIKGALIDLRILLVEFVGTCMDGFDKPKGVAKSFNTEPRALNRPFGNGLGFN